MAERKRGYLIVLDGIDGSGKETQTRLLMDRLQKEGLKSHTMSFPRYHDGYWGNFIDGAKVGKYGEFIGASPYLASIPYANDRRDAKTQLDSLLAEGNILVLDRYVSANAIHQGGKLPTPDERKVYMQWLDNLEYIENKIPRPDIVLFLDVSVEVSIAACRSRAEKDGTSPDLAETNAKHLFESRTSALDVAQSDASWVRIDCMEKNFVEEKRRKPEEIADEIFERLKNRFLWSA